VAWQALVVTQFLAAGFMFLLAGWLLWLNFPGRVTRSFALFLFFRGMTMLTNRLQDLAPSLDLQLYWQRVGEYFFLALVPSVVYFLLVYERPRGEGGFRLARWLVLLGGVLVEYLYVADHCLDLCAAPDGRVHLGPLSLLSYGVNLAYGFVGLWLSIEFLRSPAGPKKDAAFLVSLAFTLNALLDGSLSLAFGLRAGFPGVTDSFVPSPWVPLALSTYVLGLVPALLAFGLYVAAAVREPPARRRVGYSVGAGLAAALSGGLVGWGLPLPENLSTLGLFVLGLWRMILPILVAYALLRHRLFDLDVKLHWTIRRGSVWFIYLAVFFIASQQAQSYLDDRYGWAIGGLVTGLLLFALHPLQRLGEIIAYAALPRMVPLGAFTHPQRAGLYRDQARLAWADGGLDRSERLLLDQLRERLGLTVEEASVIEREVLGASI
jgi:hypothetical protein